MSKTYLETKPKTWNTHDWETNDESYIPAFCEMGFYDLQLNEAKNGYEIVTEMAAEMPKDVTSTITDDEIEYIKLYDLDKEYDSNVIELDYNDDNTIGEISTEMEKVLNQMPMNETIKAETVLEINENHKIANRIKPTLICFENFSSSRFLCSITRFALLNISSGMVMIFIGTTMLVYLSTYQSLSFLFLLLLIS